MEKVRRKASEEYLAKLRDPRWQKKRLEILQRDNFTCQHCENAEKTLHVHHKTYFRGNQPWEYLSSFLVTLCEDCHAYESECRAEADRNLAECIRVAGFQVDEVQALVSSMVSLQSDKNFLPLIRESTNFFALPKIPDALISDLATLFHKHLGEQVE